MASSTVDRDEPAQEIRLRDVGDLWVATDLDTGVTSQGETRTEALENLDEAVALYHGETGESIDTLDDERAVLRDLGIDPDEVQRARENTEELPEFMQ